MDRLTAMRVFVETADRGSLSAAAEALQMSRAMASRYLEALEHWTGARLLHRTTRRIGLTDAGEQALPRCREMLDLADELHARSGRAGLAASGRLRLTSSPSFAETQLAPAIVDFQRQHPLVEVELLLVDRAVDLAQERIDLAVRITNRLDPGLVSRRLASCRSVLCAAPAYLRRQGQPATPDELKAHACLAHSSGPLAEFRLHDGERTQRLAVRGPFTANDTSALRAAARAGAGIAMLPTYYVAEDLARRSLVRVLPRHEPEALAVHAVYLSRRHQPHALRLLLDFLVERFAGDPPPWDRAPAISRRR